MHDSITNFFTRTGIGVTGWLTSTWLQDINAALSILVALATLVFLIVSIREKLHK